MRHSLKNARSLSAFLFLSGVLATGTAEAGKPAEQEPINPAIVYTDLEDGALFVMSADGTRKQRLTQPPPNSADTRAAWMPGVPELPAGDWISFMRTGGGLYVINSDGSGETLLRSFDSSVEPVPSYHADDIVWGPFGERLVYASHGIGSGIWLIHPFDGETRRRRLAETFHETGYAVASPTLSPDTDISPDRYQGWLAWYEYEVPAAHLPEAYADIYVVTIEIEKYGSLNILGDPINLTAELQTREPGFYGHPAWSPDGQWLAFVEETAGFCGIDRIAWDSLNSDPVPVHVVETSLNLIRISWTTGQFILYDDYQPPHSRRGRTTLDLMLIDPFSNNDEPFNLTETDRIYEEGPSWNPAWGPSNP